MRIQKCSVKDAEKLAILNKCLIQDEKSGNAMEVGELETRMRGFLETDYSAYFFIESGEKIGYALVNNARSPIYLRQFFIDRNCRNRHYGSQAFQMLLKTLGAKEIDLEVLPWNENALSFWKHLGFMETCIAMRYAE